MKIIIALLGLLASIVQMLFVNALIILLPAYIINWVWNNVIVFNFHFQELNYLEMFAILFAIKMLSLVIKSDSSMHDISRMNDEFEKEAEESAEEILHS